MLEHLFQQVIQWEENLGKNEYGKITFAPPLPVNVRYEGTNKLVRMGNGDRVESQYLVFTDHAIKIGDRLEIDGRKLLVLEVIATPDPNNLEEILFREVYT